MSHKTQLESAFEYSVNDITYSLIKSARRKTVSIQVRQGSVIVRTPERVCEQFVNQFISSKYNWLKTKLKEQECALVPRIEFCDGALIPYLGENLNVEIHLAAKPKIVVTDNVLVVYLSARTFRNIEDSGTSNVKIRQLYESWLKIKAQEYIEPRIQALAETMSVTYNQVIYKRYKARWGSCNSKAELSFNSLLMMCPPWVIDYVIVHELSHLTYLNHSSKFWMRVNQFYPNYKKAQQWLKSHAYYIR